MKVTKAEGLLCALVSLSIVAARNMPSSTSRTQITPLGESIKKLTGQLIKINSTDIITDTRTPPKVKQMMKKVEQRTERTTEKFHPGIAEPVDEEIDVLEESMKKLNFYKLEKPTTDSGLSTWILLSGQSTNSLLTTKLPTVTSKDAISTKNATVISNPNRVVKPVFKKRPTVANPKTTTPTPKPTTITSIPIIPISTLHPEKTTKFTKIKASLLNNVMNNKNSTLATLSTSKTNSSNDMKKNDTKIVKVDLFSNVTNVQTDSSTEITPELKSGDLELSSNTTNSKKSRRPTNKKKKDKNRRKRPSVDYKNDDQNKTKISNKNSQKEKPISTQIYNYLAREVMPTVGVGLVGLVVTAGLASYFLYPFGSLRRSYEVDRRDKDYSYYYDGGKVALDYDSGIAEEEAIGKVIAGMPFSSGSYNNNYRQSNSRNTYMNNRYGQINSMFYSKPQGSVESVQLNPIRDYNKNENYVHDSRHTNEVNKNEPITYNKDIMSQNFDAPYVGNDQNFVVGNAPKEIIEEITPAAVPEHGPRSLIIRKRRNTKNYISNEIDVDSPPEKFDQIDNSEIIIKNSKNNSIHAFTDANNLTQKVYTFMDFFRDLFASKLKVGLELLHNQTLAITRYLTSVQKGLEKLRNNNGRND